MTVKPPAFETLFLDLSASVDLTANATILPFPPDLPAAERASYADAAYGEREIFLQCIAGSARWRETAARPAATDAGHILGYGDGVIVTLQRGRPFWVWGAATGTRVAVSPASAAPTRDATYDARVEPA